MVWDSRWLVNDIDHVWSCMIVHGRWGSSVVILYLEHANLGDRSETRWSKCCWTWVILIAWICLNSIIDLQVFLFDVELILMTVFPALGRSRKLSCLFMSFFCQCLNPTRNQSVTRISAKLTCLTGCDETAPKGAKGWGQRAQHTKKKLWC